MVGATMTRTSSPLLVSGRHQAQRLLRSRYTSGRSIGNGFWALFLLAISAAMPPAVRAQSEAVALSNGVAVTNLSAAIGESLDYYIDIPAGTQTLRVTLGVNGNGDPDLYVDTRSPPPTTGAACQSVLAGGNSEKCVINRPTTGRYYIRVLAYSSYTDAVLTATLLSPPAASTISQITPGDGSLQVAFSPGAGTADSYTVSCVDPNMRSSSEVLAFVIEPETANFSPAVMQRISEEARGQRFGNAKAFHTSNLFSEAGLRCGTMEYGGARSPVLNSSPVAPLRAAADCTATQTTISPEHVQPVGQVLRIPVYFHVIYKADGEGYVSEARIRDQMAVLNEDFAGANGLSTQNTAIQFDLVFINYVQSDYYFADEGAGGIDKYALTADTERYMNVYTNDAGGVLGYATLPQSGAGGAGDGIVMRHQSIGGRNNGYGSYDEGRTLVHEVGHYLGLRHTFNPEGDCTNSYTGGDLIVDTPPQLNADYGTQPSTDCGPPSAIDNFMNYSDDDAMYTFTSEQVNRMTCSLLNYRSNTYATASSNTFSASGTASPITVLGLTNGRAYNCSVTATNSAGTSAASGVVAGTPEAPSVPTAPVISRIDTGDGELNVSITLTGTGGLAITGYGATCTDGTRAFSATSITPSVTVTGLTNGVSYSCSVNVSNALGSSASSAVVASSPESPATTLPLWIFYEAMRANADAPNNEGEDSE